MNKGLALVNAARRQQGQTPIADQEDHFHALREGQRALRQMQGRVSRLLDKAEREERKEQQKFRRTGSRQGRATASAKAWRAAERAMDQWSAAERAWGQIEQGLRLFTARGELNSRAGATAVIQEALPHLSGREWSKVRRQLGRPELLTFLDRAQAGVAALPLAAEVRQAVVRVEGLRRHPEALTGEGASAGAMRGILLAASLVLWLLGTERAQALELVRGVLAGAWRASSLVECINSVARMQQARHRRMTQGLLDLKRLYWNCHVFRTGKRRGKSPYELLGVPLPRADWWALLKLTPEQLRQELSAYRVAA